MNAILKAERKKRRGERRLRNQRIVDVYESRPDWKLKDLAKMFDVSVATIFYVINGRNGKKKTE